MQRNAPSAGPHPEKKYLCHPKSLTSGALHYLGLALAIIGTVCLIRKGLRVGLSTRGMISVILYGLSMMLLYGASGTYHTFYPSETAHRALRKLDHSMIFLLVAGTYTPICVISLWHTTIGKVLLFGIWGTAVVSILISVFWGNAPRFLISLVTILMGWAAVMAFYPLWQALPRAGFWFLILGGVAYTVGGIFYALKIPRFRFEAFGAHEFFHILILLGSILHFVMIYGYIVA